MLCEWQHGGELLRVLYAHSRHGAPWRAALVAGVLRQAAAPLLAAICSWVGAGRLPPPAAAADFFVLERPGEHLRGVHSKPRCTALPTDAVNAWCRLRSSACGDRCAQEQAAFCTAMCEAALLCATAGCLLRVSVRKHRVSQSSLNRRSILVFASASPSAICVSLSSRLLQEGEQCGLSHSTKLPVQTLYAWCRDPMGAPFSTIDLALHRRFEQPVAGALCSR